MAIIKTVLLVALVLAFATSVAASPSLGPRRAAVKAGKLEPFLEGVAFGLGIEFGANVTGCVADAEAVESDLEVAFKDIRDGFEHLNPAEVERGLQELGAVVKVLVQAMKD